MKFDLKKFEQLVTIIGPPILQMVGVPSTVITLAAHGIVVAENIKGKSGAEKKAYVTELVSTGAQAVNAATGKTLLDPAQLSGTVSQGIDAVVAAVNAVENIPVGAGAGADVSADSH